MGSKGSDTLMGLVSLAMLKTAMITITIMSASEFIYCAIVQIQILTYGCRFSERDLLMRYHWGLGVGHLHAHQSATTSIYIPGEDAPDIENEEIPNEGDIQVNIETQDGMSDVFEPYNPELDLEDRELEGWEDIQSEELQSGVEDEDMEEDNFIG